MQLVWGLILFCALVHSSPHDPLLSLAVAFQSQFSSSSDFCVECDILSDLTSNQFTLFPPKTHLLLWLHGIFYFIARRKENLSKLYLLDLCFHIIRQPFHLKRSTYVFCFEWVCGHGTARSFHHSKQRSLDLQTAICGSAVIIIQRKTVLFGWICSYSV